jgi:hypothetical protein
MLKPYFFDQGWPIELIKLGWKGLTGTNTLTYLAIREKSFVTTGEVLQLSGRARGYK